jgi:MFS family permease
MTARFIGWRVVAAAFVTMGVSSGLGFYATTLYLRALTDERGFSVGSVSGATAVFFTVSGLAGMVVARLIARFDLRAVVSVGAVVAAAGTVMIGRATQLWHVYAAYAFFAVGYGACALVPGTTVVTRWFHRRRSLALSIASTGVSVGGFALVPVAQWLIDDHGLDGATPWLAAIFVGLVAPTALVFLSPDPAALGMRPDGDPEPPPDALPVATGMTYAEAIRTPWFRAISIAFTLVFAAQVGGIAHQFNLVSDRLDEATAAFSVSLLAFCSAAGRLVGGVVATRLALRKLAVVMALVQLAGLVVLGAGSSRVVVLVGAALLGVSIGNLLLLQPLLLAESFGVRDYPRIYSLCQLLSTTGVAGGPVLVGLMHDAFDGYGLAFAAAAACSAASATILALRRPPTRTGATTSPEPATSTHERG